MLAASGDVKAERDLGLKYLAGDGVQANESQAARWLMRAAYRGEPTAEYWLGTLYARGHGVPEDAFQANHWYEAAAQKGNRRAMHSFAVAYFQGWGVEKNYSEAARWFRSAADLGFVDSQFNLAVLYERGAGIQQSLTEAYKWYAIAAQGGDKEVRDARCHACDPARSGRSRAGATGGGKLQAGADGPERQSRERREIHRRLVSPQRTKKRKPERSGFRFVLGQTLKRNGP